MTAFYTSTQTGNNQQKYLIYFVGGGFCEGNTLADTLEACYKRSFTWLGSTANTTETRNFEGHGLLSPLQEENPVFYDWTKIFVMYCDGSEYAGSLDSSVSYKDK